MERLYVCNTGSDYISELNINTLKEKRINLTSYNEKIGPYSLASYGDFIVVINKYSSSLVKIKKENYCYKEYHSIGAQPNDIKIYKDTAYILCGEGDSLITFDLKGNKISQCINCGLYPHRIDIEAGLGLGAITNMLSDDILLLDCEKNTIIKKIPVNNYPTKAILINEGKELLVCESFMGTDKPGRVKHIDVISGSIIGEIKVGNYPADILYEDEENCYITNFNDGSVSIISLKEMREKEKLFFRGMPMGILRRYNHLYIGDNHNNALIRYDLIHKKAKIIPLGKEPNGMIIL